MKGLYLITTDDWFIAPDGQSYKAAWGNTTIVGDDILGIKTNSRATNWFAKVGSEDKHIIIAGCQIHYAVRCENKPKLEKHISELAHEGKPYELENMTRIYIAQ